MRSQFMRQMALLLAGAACASTAGLAAEQAYPTKPIRLLVPFAPGGGADLIARLVAPRLSERFGQSVVVDNRPTAAGTLAAELTARATPDGHTLFVPTSNHVANPSLFKLSYDTINDFAPITLAVISPLVLVVHPSLPVNTVQEFIAYAKSNPDKLNYGTAGAGGPPPPFPGPPPNEGREQDACNRLKGDRPRRDCGARQRGPVHVCEHLRRSAPRARRTFARAGNYGSQTL